MELFQPKRKEIRRFESQLTKAHRKREKMLADGRLSVESAAGRLAILVSDQPSYAYTKAGAKAHHLTFDEYLSRQIESFGVEAERISKRKVEEHDSVIWRNANSESIARAFRNPDVSDIVLIGHGSINTIWTNDGNFDWWKAARAADHLKQGVIEQRMCGHFPNKEGLNVPLGTFAVARYSNVKAVTGHYTSESDPGDKIFTPVFNDHEDIMTQLGSLNAMYAGGKRPKED